LLWQSKIHLTAQHLANKPLVPAVMNRMAVPLKDGTSIDITGFGAFYSDDTSVQRKGLKINHYLKKNTKNYKYDFYIEEALKLIDHSL